MLIFLCVTVGLLLLYGILIAYYQYAWNNIPQLKSTGFDATKEKIKITIIIPARNEQTNIASCLTSLRQQTYPAELLEIIVVNDHSTDNTEDIIRNFPASNIKLINLSEHLHGAVLNSYKKKAIEVAIAAASGDLIITTDADCTATANWIMCLAEYHQLTGAVLLAAPVKIEHTGSLLSMFQSIDFLTLQGITGASVSAKFHSMCNGANLAYEKKVFNEVGGFKDIDNIASGDDMLLMHKIVTKYPDRFVFVKETAAIVSTGAAVTWGAFLNQRIRWASKADTYKDKRIFSVLLLVYILNLFILVFLFAAFWQLHFIYIFLVLIGIKTIVEFSFVRKVACFFNQQHLMFFFPLLQPIHILYTIVAGWLGKFGSYEWKSRKVK